MSGLVTNDNGLDEGSITNLVSRNGIALGNEAIGDNSRGTSTSSSRVGMYNRVFAVGGRVCVVLGGPGNIISTDSKGNREAIYTLIPRRLVHHKLFPTNELSGSAANFILVASSNRFTRHVLSPGGRVSGACIISLHSGVRRRTISLLRGNVALHSKATFLPSGVGVLSSGRYRVAVYRNGCRRVGHVFYTIKGRIAGLHHVGVKQLFLSRELESNRYHRVATSRLGVVSRGRWISTMFTGLPLQRLF